MVNTVKMIKTLTVLAILFCASAYSQSIRGVNATLEEAFFILVDNADVNNPNSRKVVFIKTCDSCPETLIATQDTEIVTTVNQIKTADYLKNNTTYFAGVISYQRDTNVVLSIMLSVQEEG
jgi:hypothetical protein